MQIWCVHRATDCVNVYDSHPSCCGLPHPVSQCAPSLNPELNLGGCLPLTAILSPKIQMQHSTTLHNSRKFCSISKLTDPKWLLKILKDYTILHRKMLQFEKFAVKSCLLKFKTSTQH